MRFAGFTSALWVGVGLSAVGVLAALLAPARRRTAPASVARALVVEEPSGA